MLSQISVRTISRLINDQECAVSDSQIVALSVGLHLPPAVSNEFMGRKLGKTMATTQDVSTGVPIFLEKARMRCI